MSSKKKKTAVVPDNPVVDVILAKTLQLMKTKDDEQQDEEQSGEQLNSACSSDLASEYTSSVDSYVATLVNQIPSEEDEQVRSLAVGMRELQDREARLSVMNHALLLPRFTASAVHIPWPLPTLEHEIPSVVQSLRAGDLRAAFLHASSPWTYATIAYLSGDDRGCLGWFLDIALERLFSRRRRRITPVPWNVILRGLLVSSLRSLARSKLALTLASIVLLGAAARAVFWRMRMKTAAFALPLDFSQRPSKRPTAWSPPVNDGFRRAGIRDMHSLSQSSISQSRDEDDEDLASAMKRPVVYDAPVVPSVTVNKENRVFEQPSAESRYAHVLLVSD
jgi:hypothetical protein